jgi:hypothetical protein
MSENELIAALAREGMFAYYIGQKFGLSAKRVIHICDQLGVQVQNKHWQTMTRKAQIETMLRKGGHTVRQICDTVNCDPVNVRQVRHQLGMKQPTPCRKHITDESRKKATRAAELVRAGMTVKDACRANRISPNTYHKYQKLAQVPRLDDGVQTVSPAAARRVVERQFSVTL